MFTEYIVFYKNLYKLSGVPKNCMFTEYIVFYKNLYKLSDVPKNCMFTEYFVCYSRVVSEKYNDFLRWHSKVIFCLSKLSSMLMEIFVNMLLFLLTL